MTKEQDYQDLIDIVEAVAVGDEIEWTDRKPVITDKEARAFLKSIGVKCRLPPRLGVVSLGNANEEGD